MKRKKMRKIKCYNPEKKGYDLLTLREISIWLRKEKERMREELQSLYEIEDDVIRDRKALDRVGRGIKL